MGAVLTYIVFTVAVVLGVFLPFVGMLGYVWFVSVVPQFLWRFSLVDPRFDFQKYIAISAIIGFCISGFRGVRLSSCAYYSVLAGCGYWALSFLSTLSSVEPPRSWFFIEQFSKIAVMSFVLIKVLDSERRVRTAIWVILCAVGWNALEINRDYYSRGFSNINQDGWALQNANGYALILVMVAVISLGMLLTAKGRFQQTVLFLVCILSVHSIYIVESRGGMIGLIIGAVLIFLLQEKNTRNLVGFFSIAILALILAGPSVTKEFASSFNENDDLDTSASDRFAIWSGGIRLTLDNPLLGVGPWAAEIPMSKYASETGVAKYTGRVHLHNLPLEVSTGSGLPALICYTGLFFLPVFGLVKQFRMLRGQASQGLTCGVISAVPAYWLASVFNSGALLEVPYLVCAVSIALHAGNERLLDAQSLTSAILDGNANEPDFIEREQGLLHEELDYARSR